VTLSPHLFENDLPFADAAAMAKINAHDGPEFHAQMKMLIERIAAQVKAKAAPNG
jgi:hypothetical protein